MEKSSQEITLPILQSLYATLQPVRECLKTRETETIVSVHADKRDVWTIREKQRAADVDVCCPEAKMNHVFIPCVIVIHFT